MSKSSDIVLIMGIKNEKIGLLELDFFCMSNLGKPLFWLST